MIRKTGTFDSIFKICDDQPNDTLRQYPSFSFKDYKSFGLEGQSQEIINWNFVACPSEQKAQTILQPGSFGVPIAPFESNIRVKASARLEPLQPTTPSLRVPCQQKDPSIRPKNMRISKKNRELISCPKFGARGICDSKRICCFR